MDDNYEVERLPGVLTPPVWADSDPIGSSSRQFIAALRRVRRRP